VCATIHQPSSEIFQCFDDLVLLADGNVGGALILGTPWACVPQLPCGH
jgi:hypothetical protein